MSTRRDDGLRQFEEIWQFTLPDFIVWMDRTTRFFSIDTKRGSVYQSSIRDRNAIQKWMSVPTTRRIIVDSLVFGPFLEVAVWRAPGSSSTVSNLPLDIFLWWKDIADEAPGVQHAGF